MRTVISLYGRAAAAFWVRDRGHGSDDERFPPVKSSVIDDPEETAGVVVGRASHDLFDQTMESEDRYQLRSLILTSQLPVTSWHEQIGDPIVADDILYRLVPNAHRIEMRGDSMRKNRSRPHT